MSITPKKCRVTILVKALPRPSKNYGETVCCAGVTSDGQWKRLYPVRFRHLQGAQSFSRWDNVEFKYRAPTHDIRTESCHVFEDSISIGGKMPVRERARLLNPIIVGSAEEATSRGQSLALIRPTQTRFIIKKKTAFNIEREVASFNAAARQTSLLDKELATFNPAPFHFAFKFDDQSGQHTYSCGDWEVSAMFYNGRRRDGEAKTLQWMKEVFDEEYPSKGMAFALGNIAKRPQTWQLLGVIRLDELNEPELKF